MASDRPLLQLAHVTRRFPGVLALDDVAFDLRAGEVHALVGENGAGKSTLLNLISGVLEPDAGEIRLDGQPVRLENPVAARRLGIVAVHQEADLFEPLSLAENLALLYGLPTQGGWVSWRRVYRQARAAVDETGEAFDVYQAAGRLSVAHRHMAQVAAAVARQARVLVLDEPTSALSAAESDWLFAQIARLKFAGVGIVYISHRQEEIFALADRITVLRDGRRVWSGAAAETNPSALVEAMVGRAAAPSNRRATTSRGGQSAGAQPRLRVEEASDKNGRFRDISLAVWPGEILGVYGLVGAGRSEFAQALFGLRPGASGKMYVDGRQLPLSRTDAAVRAAIAYVPEDRLQQGLCRGLSVRANMLLSSLRELSRGLLLSPWRELAAAAAEADALAVRRRSLSQPVGQLSGGNQQKVVLGRWLLTGPKVLILDEPTRGVDVAAKAEIHRIIRERAQAGAAVVMISSELTEIMEHADRLLVFREGQVADEFRPAETTAAEVARAALPATAAGQRAAGSDAVRRRRSRAIRPEWGLLGIVGILALVLALTSPVFATEGNLVNLLAGASVTAILALAAALVIIAGGIDISVGSLLALAAAACGLVLKTPHPPAVTVPAGIVCGLAVGLVGGGTNGLLTLVGRVHPIVVTLGTMTIYRGLLIAVTGGDAITDLPDAFSNLAHARVLRLEGAIWIMLATVAVTHVWLGYTRYGRYQYAVGASATAARLAGISRGRVTLLAFGAGGLLAGLAGVVELARSGSMQSGLGAGYELSAIAAAVIGGTAINGGRGTALGVFLGAILLSLVSNALVLWEVSRFHRDLVIGGLILAAVILDRGWRRLES